MDRAKRYADNTGPMIRDRHWEWMEEAYRFILCYTKTEGISPTIREVQKHLGLSSSSIAYGIVKSLEEDGRITRKKNSPRTIQITDLYGSGQGEG